MQLQGLEKSNCLCGAGFTEDPGKFAIDTWNDQEGPHVIEYIRFTCTFCMTETTYLKTTQGWAMAKQSSTTHSVLSKKPNYANFAQADSATESFGDGLATVKPAEFINIKLSILPEEEKKEEEFRRSLIL